MSGFAIALGAMNGAYNIANDAINRDTQDRWRKEDQEREDTAITRTVDDAQRAGFSPLVATSAMLGSSASPTPVSSTSDPFGSAASAVDNAVSQKLQAEAQKMQKQLVESQIANIDADTRDKNASAAVNEGTVETQILKAKSELESMIQGGNFTKAQITKYINDLKANGMDSQMIDTLLKSFQNDGYDYGSSSDYKSSESISSGINLSRAQANLANAQKALADVNKTKTEGEYNNWNENLKAIERDILDYERAIKHYEEYVSDYKLNNISVKIDMNGTIRNMPIEAALQALDVGIKNTQSKLSSKNLSNADLQKTLDALNTFYNGMSTVVSALGGAR